MPFTVGHRRVGRVRAIFFDEDSARAVVRRLTADGFDAHAERLRLAGEDDDEDHPWAVTSDAPDFILEVAADEYDGWLEGDEPAPPLAPIELPTEPMRIKRPEGGPPTLAP